MSNFPLLQYRALDNNGDPISGAKLYTYEGGTTTPLAVYSDRARSSAHANPVVSDANGWFDIIYMTPNTSYKVVLKSSDDVTTYWTEDAVYAVTGSDSSAETRMLQGFASPLDYPESGVDAVGDGSADEYAQVQNAIDAATGTVDLLGKTFRCDSAITLKSGLTLKNGTLDFSNSSDDNLISGSGTLGADNALGGNVTRGGQTITLTSGDGLAVKDWMLLSSNGTFDGTNKEGELIQLGTVVLTIVGTKTPVHNTYNTADTAICRKLTPVTNVRLEDLIIIGPNGAATTMVRLLYCVGVEIRNCLFKDFGVEAVMVQSSARVTVEGCTFEVAQSSASGCGVEIHGASQDVLVTGCRATRAVLAMVDKNTQDYQSRYVTIRECKAEAGSLGIKVQDNAQHVVIENNMLTMDASVGSTQAAIQTECPDVTIRGNTILNSVGPGIEADMASVSPTASWDYDLSIEDNFVRDCDNEGIKATGGASRFTHACVRRNRIYDPGADGIMLTSLHGKYATCSDNFVDGAGEHGILLVNMGNCVCGHNNIANPTNHGIAVDNATVVNPDQLLSIIGNVIETPGNSGIDVDNTDGSSAMYLAVTNNQVGGVTTAGDHCLKLADQVAFSVVAGNNFHRSDDLDDNIQLAGGGAGQIDEILFTANVLINGDYGIGEPTDPNNTNIGAIGNIISGMSSGAFEGTIDMDVAVDDHYS